MIKKVGLIPFFSIITLLLSACSSLPSNAPYSFAELKTSYDYQLFQAGRANPITFNDLVHQLQGVDVVFMGEFHGNHASHLLEAQLQAALYSQQPNQVLTLEQFTTDKQPVLDRYLDSEIGEKPFIKQANAWQNYVGSYRPLVEFAKRDDLPVYATNAPEQVVRCVGRKGKAYLSPAVQQQYPTLPKQPFVNDADYEAKFTRFVAKVGKHNTALKNGYSAQLLRDNSMAETILQALKDHPNAQVLHINGTFHSEDFLGTVALLKQRNPTLTVAVISPLHTDEAEEVVSQPQIRKSSFFYMVNQQPAEFVQYKNRQKMLKASFTRSATQPCL